MLSSLQISAAALAKSRFRRQIRWLLGTGASEPVYPRLDWLKARLMGAMARQPLYRGVRVEWDGPMHGWCVPFDIAGPRDDEVLIRTLVSAVSTGTETAVFSSLPNTGASFPSHPGYSGAGEVVRVGRGVRGIAVGQLVAGRASHASLALLHASEAFPVPGGMRPEEAAFTHIGIIAFHGVRRAAVRPAERVAVFGRGIVGQLAVQLLRQGDLTELTSIARSRRHVTPVLQRYADHVISLDSDQDVVRDLQVDVAFDVTGDPAALPTAVRATRDGGRVILLGSSRGITRAFDFGALAERRITLVGANIRTLTSIGHDPGSTYRDVGQEFLRLVADGSVDVASLIDLDVNPWEAGRFYRHLTEGSMPCIAPIFHWDRLEARDRARRVAFVSPPALEAIRARTMLLPSAGVA